MCYSNSNGETRASSFSHFSPSESRIIFAYHNLRRKRLSSSNAFSRLLPFPHHSPGKRLVERYIKCNTCDNYSRPDCIYLWNNFKTFSDDRPSLAPLARITLFQRAPFSVRFPPSLATQPSKPRLRDSETKMMI